MAISGSPLAMARDIADGFLSLSPLTLKKYTPSDLKTINANLNLVLREVRGEVVSPEDTAAVRRKNLRLQRINQALLILNAYCKQTRIAL